MLAGARPAAREELMKMSLEALRAGDGLSKVCHIQSNRTMSSSAQTAAMMGRVADARFDMTLPLVEKPTPEGCQLTGFCGEGNEGKQKQITLPIGPIMPLC